MLQSSLPTTLGQADQEWMKNQLSKLNFAEGADKI